MNRRCLRKRACQLSRINCESCWSTPFLLVRTKEKNQRNGVDVAHTHEDFGPLLVGLIQELKAISSSFVQKYLTGRA